MDKSVNLEKAVETDTKVERPSRAEAEQAVRTLLAWTGDNPAREGLLDTPKRVIDAYTKPPAPPLACVALMAMPRWRNTQWI